MFKQVSFNIKHLRKAAKLSQSDLADYLHISRQQVANYEKGDTTIPLVSIVKMSEIFNISIDALVNQDFNNLDDDALEKTHKKANISDSIINTNALATLIDDLIEQKMKKKLGNVEDLLYKMLAILKSQEIKDVVIEELQELDQQIKDTLHKH